MAAAMARAQESLARSVATSELVAARWPTADAAARAAPPSTGSRSPTSPVGREPRLSPAPAARRSTSAATGGGGGGGGNGSGSSSFRERPKTPARSSRSREEIQDLGNSYLSQLRVASSSGSPRGTAKPPQSWEWVEEKVRTEGGVERNWTRRSISPGRAESPTRTERQQDSLEDMRRKMSEMEERARQRKARERSQRGPSPDASPSYAYGENPALMTFLRSLALQHHHKMFVRLGVVNGLRGLDRVDLNRVGLSQADQRLFSRALRTLPTTSTAQAERAGQGAAVSISFGSSPV